MDQNVSAPDLAQSTELDRQSRDVVTSLDRIFNYLMAMIPAEAAGPEVPLTFAEVRAAKLLPPEGAVSMRQLAETLGVPLPSATHLVDRLVEKGVVVRVRLEYDRRVVLVELSEHAKTYREALFQRRVELIERIIDPLSPAVREQVARTFTEIAESASIQAATLRSRA